MAATGRTWGASVSWKTNDSFKTLLIFHPCKTWRNKIKFCAPFDEWGNKSVSMMTDKRHCAASFNSKSRGMQTAFSPVDFLLSGNVWRDHLISAPLTLVNYWDVFVFFVLLCNISKYSRQQVYIEKSADARRCVLLIVENRGVHQDSCRSGCGREEWWWVSQCGTDAAARSKALSVDNLHREQKTGPGRSWQAPQQFSPWRQGKMLEATWVFPLLCSCSISTQPFKEGWEKHQSEQKCAEMLKQCTGRENNRI